MKKKILDFEKKQAHLFNYSHLLIQPSIVTKIMDKGLANCQADIEAYGRVIHWLNNIPLEKGQAYAPSKRYHRNAIRNFEGDFDKRLQDLIKLNIVVRHRYDKDKGIPFGYLLADEFVENPQIFQVTHPKIHSILTEQKKKNSLVIEDVFNHKWLFNNFTKHDIHFSDTDYAYEIALKDLPDNDLVQRRIQMHKNCSSMYSINNIDLELYTFKEGTTGRIYTPITNMSKLARKELMIRDDFLQEIDIKASQPYFSLLLVLHPDFKDHVLDTPPRLLDNKKTAYKLMEKVVNDKDPFNGKAVLANAAPDLLKFVELVTEGDIYTYMQEKAELKNRDEAKTFYQAAIYGSNEYHHGAKLFKKLFPTVYKELRKYKYHDYAVLARFLQLVESYFMIDHIPNLIRKFDSSIPVYTIHDCYMTLPEHIEFLEDLMTKELSRAVGFKPRFG